MALSTLTRGSEFTADFEGAIYKKRSDFFLGSVLSGRDEILLWPSERGGDDLYYAWAGSYPKTVLPGSTPATSGGVSSSAWSIVTSAGRSATVKNIADLKRVNPLRASSVETLGYYEAGDGGHGIYYLDPQDKTSSDDGGSVIVGAFASRWKLVHSGTVNILQFGARPGLSSNNYSQINTAIQAVKNYGGFSRGGVVEVPNGIYSYAGTLLLDSPCVTIKGNGMHSSFLRGTSLNVPLIKVTGPYCRVVDCEVATSAEGVSGSCGFEISGAEFMASGYSISGAYDGIRIRGGSLHRFSKFSISDCRNTGFLFNGDAPSLFLNDIFIEDWYIGTTDNTKFQLGHFRALGRVEALMIGRGDGIGGRYSFTCDSLGTVGMRYATLQSAFFDSTTFGAVFTDCEHLHLTDCWASNGRGSNSPGISFLGCSHFSLKGFQGYECGGQGIFITYCSDFSLNSCDVTSNSKDGSLIAPGILIDNSTRFTVASCMGGKGAAGFQTFGLLVGTNCSNYSLDSNNFFDNVSGSIFEDAGNVFRRASHNTNYITRSKDVASLSAGSTSVTVAHLLSRAPQIQDISITCNTATASPLYVTAVTGTTFTVETQVSNSGIASFSWTADITS